MTRFARASHALVVVAIAGAVVACVLALDGVTPISGRDEWTGGAAGFRLWVFGALVPVVAVTVVVHLRRPQHVLGQRLAVAAALLTLSTSIGLWLHGADDGSNVRHVLAFVGAASDLLAIGAVALLLATFPTGRIVPAFERVACWSGLAVVAASCAALVPVRVRIVAALTPPWSPLQVPSLTFFGSRGEALLFFASLAPLAAIGILLWRAPARSDEERMHLRWLALAGVAAVALLATVHLVRRLGIVELGGGFYSVAPRVIGWLLVASAVAITTLRPDVADAAAAVRRVAVASALLVTLGLAGALTWFAADATTGTTLPGVRAVAAGLTVAALFFPARDRFERIADRWLFGDTIGDAELLSGFGRQAERTGDLHELADLVAATAQRGLHVAWAKASLAGPYDVRPGPVAVAGVLRESTSPPVATVDLANAGDVVGRLECGPKRRGGFTEHDRSLLAALAREAALGVQNARQASELAQQVEQIRIQAAELAASRTRIVQAQEAERRRIERNIHDGAQQELAALIAKLRLAQNQLARSPDTAARTIEEAQHDVRRALDDLRALARGIHPAVLSDRGLLDAIEAGVSRLPLEVAIDVDPALRGERFPDEIEGAAYFVTSEALANVLKYSAASRVEVVIRVSGDRLEVRITDDGIGFDPAAVDGTGLANLADRAAALGGTLRVESRPGDGTTVCVDLPVALSASR